MLHFFSFWLFGPLALYFGLLGLHCGLLGLHFGLLLLQFPFGLSGFHFGLLLLQFGLSGFHFRILGLEGGILWLFVAFWAFRGGILLLFVPFWAFIWSILLLFVASFLFGLAFWVFISVFWGFILALWAFRGGILLLFVAFWAFGGGAFLLCVAAMLAFARNLVIRGFKGGYPSQLRAPPQVAKNGPFFSEIYKEFINAVAGAIFQFLGLLGVDFLHFGFSLWASILAFGASFWHFGPCGEPLALSGLLGLERGYPFALCGLLSLRGGVLSLFMAVKGPSSWFVTGPGKSSIFQPCFCFAVYNMVASNISIMFGCI